MKIIAKPVKERAVLTPTSKKAEPAGIHASIVAKAQCCVDHLCGCKS